MCVSHHCFTTDQRCGDAWGLDAKRQRLTRNHTATLFSEDRGGPGVEECYVKCENVMLQSSANTAQATVPAAGLPALQMPRSSPPKLPCVSTSQTSRGQGFSPGRGVSLHQKGGWPHSLRLPIYFPIFCPRPGWRILLLNYPFH